MVDRLLTLMYQLSNCKHIYKNSIFIFSPEQQKRAQQPFHFAKEHDILDAFRYKLQQNQFTQTRLGRQKQQNTKPPILDALAWLLPPRAVPPPEYCASRAVHTDKYRAAEYQSPPGP